MKCSTCKFYIKSKVYGNNCSCRNNKPCEIKRNINKRKKLNKNKIWK